MNKILWLFIFKAILLILLSPISSNGQNPIYRLSVESGGFMDFKIYTLDRYNGGLTYTNWTRLRLEYRDTTSGRQEDKWGLTFKPTTSNFRSGVVGRNLPLEYVSIEVSDVDTLSNTATIHNGPHPLDDDIMTDLATGGDEGVYHLNVTYRLDSAVIGRIPDYYNTELFFQMDINP